MQILQDQIRAEAERLGFVSCGFARADAVPEAGERLREWLSLGRHGTMGWMEERADQRGHPQALWPEARSVIALAMSYAPMQDPRDLAAVDEFLDRLDHLVGALGDYLDGVSDTSWAVRTYGPTAVTALVALVHAQYAYLVDGPRSREHQERGRQDQPCAHQNPSSFTMSRLSR